MVNRIYHVGKEAVVVVVDDRVRHVTVGSLTCPVRGNVVVAVNSNKLRGTVVLHRDDGSRETLDVADTSDPEAARRSVTASCG